MFVLYYLICIIAHLKTAFYLMNMKKMTVGLIKLCLALDKIINM